MTVGVVIPFFQKQLGLLERALNSVVGQSIAEPIHVVVVDDESPLSAADEIACVPLRAGLTVHLVRKSNGGPASARNRGLDELGPEVTRVAFLDSDDQWTNVHLEHALTALDAGYDFFFSDHLQPGQTISAFNRAGRINPQSHPVIGSASALHGYVGDMFDQIITGNVIGTPTVVYDFVRFRTLRFDEAFYSAGEDYLFWIACARSGARFAFSTDVEVCCGFGINIYSGSGWGTEGHLLRIQNEMRYRKALLAFELTGEQRRMIEAKIDALRIEFAHDLVHRISHRKLPPASLLRAQWKLDARTLWMSPIYAGQIVARRIKGPPGS